MGDSDTIQMRVEKLYLPTADSPWSVVSFDQKSIPPWRLEATGGSEVGPMQQAFGAVITSDWLEF